MKDFVKKRIKQGLICLLVLFGIILGNIPGEVFAELPDTDFYSGKIVIKTENSDILPEGGEILSENNGMYLVDYASPSEAERAYLAMEDNPDILASPEASFVVCDGESIQKSVPKETEDSLSFIDGQVPDYSGKNVIALIDTGAKESEVMATFSVLSDDGRDDNGHGSCMVLAIKEVNPEAEIVSIKALNKSGTGSISSVYSAIKLAIKMNVKVINLSVVAKSVDENEIIKDVIREALNQNIVVVGAAGNSSDFVSNYIPGCINNVIVAGACDENGDRLSISNFGDEINWNIFAESTSEASAKLSGFIAKNCENDKTLSARLYEEVGNGLIFDAQNRENSVISGGNEAFLETEWRDFKLNSLSKEEMDFFSKGDELNSLKLSEDGEYLMLTTTDYAIPEDGSFVPAAWDYARVTSSSVLRILGTTDETGIKENQNQMLVITNADGTISSTGNLLSGYNYKIIGYTFNYTPGSFERSPKFSHLGEEAVNTESIRLMSKWADGLWDKTVTSGEKTYHSGYNTGMTQITFFPAPNTCIKYLYKSNVKLFLKGLNFNEKPVRGSYKSNDHSVWYEEGDIGSASKAYVATAGNEPYHAEVGLTLRKYKIYYQLSGNENDLYCAGTGVVGSTFDFTSAEKIANTQVKNKSLGWNYGIFGQNIRPSDSMEIIPEKTTSVETDEDGEVFYKYLITPNGSNKPGKVKLTVTANGGQIKVPGATFKLVSEKTADRENLVTDEEGKIVIEDLMWEESWDMEHDGNYVLIPVSVPDGYELPREVPFEVQREDVISDRIPEFTRNLDIQERPISLESVVNSDNSPQNIFTYTITGNDVNGKEFTFFCTSNERYERMIPAGNYRVTVEGKAGYSKVNTEYLEGFETGDILDLIKNQRGSIRYIWEYTETGNDISGDVCVNRFRK